ncbi:MAG: autotransporter outer membrane beta-barrel domain-containing protein, partial [Plesiomonas shigelloides]
TVTLTGNSTFSGNTTLLANTTLQIGNGGSTGAYGNGAITLNNGSLLAFNVNNALTIANPINGFGNLSANAYTGNQLNVTGNIGGTSALNSVTLTSNGTTVNSAGIYLNGNITTLGGQTYNGYVFAGNATLTDNGGGTILFGSDVDGVGFAVNTLTVNTSAGGGNVVFSGHVGYNGYATGAPTNQGGNFRYSVLKMVNVSAGNGTIIMGNGGASWWGTVGGTLSANSIYLANNITLSPISGALSSTLTFNGVVTGASGVCLTGGNAAADPWGVYTTNPGIWTFTQNTALAYINTGVNAVVNFAGSNITVNAPISNTGSVQQSSNGTTTLVANNSYSGTTTINANGTLIIGNGGNSGSLGTGATTDSGTLVFNLNNTQTYAGVISGAGNVAQ